MKEPTFASFKSDPLNLTILRVHHDWLMQYLHLRAGYTCLSAVRSVFYLHVRRNEFFHWD